MKNGGMGFCLAVAIITGNNIVGVAQTSESSNSPKVAIPAVTSGLLEMVEVKPASTVNVTSSRSRVFRTKSKIKKALVSDPSIAELVVVSEREFILLGKRDGAVSVILWFEDGSKSESPII